MDPVDLLRLALPFCLIGFAAGAARRIAIYRRGSARAVPLLPALSAIPRRYFVDLHHKVDRDKTASIMHISVAGGFLVALAVLTVTLVVPVVDALHWIGLASAAVMFCGSCLIGLRRRGVVPRYSDSRSGGEWVRFGFVLCAASAGFVWWFLSGGESWIAALILVVTLFELIVGAAWYSPLRHAFAGALNLGVHPRPDRFQDRTGRDTGLRSLDLTAPRLGVAHATDWDWTRRLNFDACVECGRCEAACPAYAAGQPLNPKALVQDLIVASDLGGMAGRYAGAGHTDGPIRFTGATGGGQEALVSPETLWSCTTCRACVEECPMMIEHVDAIIDLRRHEVLEQGSVPGKGVDLLTQYQASDTPSGRDPALRFDWAVGLGLPLLCEKGEADVLLWAGEAAFDARGQRTLRALVRLLKKAGITPAVLGPDERDSGDLARRLGDEATFQRLARANIATLAAYRVGIIVTPDPHVLHAFNEEYPDFGPVPPVLHHSRVLADLMDKGQLIPDRKLPGRLTYHDPCYLGRYSGEYAAPRAILSRISETFVDMERSGRRARCCGWGGGAPTTDIPGERRIPDMRMEDVAQIGAARVAVACPNCVVMLDGVSDADAEVADIAELLIEALEPGA